MINIKTDKKEYEIDSVDELYDFVYENFTEEVEESFNQMVEECAEQPFKVCGYSMDEALTLKKIDPIAYYQEVMSYYDCLISDLIYALEHGETAFLGDVEITEEEDEED